jgi:short-subunit dehydrogenase
VEVSAVVDDAMSGLRHGRAIALPGAVNALTANSVRFAPRFLVRRISGSIFKNQGVGS